MMIKRREIIASAGVLLSSVGVETALGQPSTGQGQRDRIPITGGHSINLDDPCDLGEGRRYDKFHRMLVDITGWARERENGWHLKGNLQGKVVPDEDEGPGPVERIATGSFNKRVSPGDAEYYQVVIPVQIQHPEDGVTYRKRIEWTLVPADDGSEFTATNVPDDLERTILGRCRD